MQYTPKISVITSVYNGRKYIAECIKSVQSQTYPAIEHIVIDGGSTDGTQEVLRQYNDQLYYWVSEKDRGIYHAWNKGLAAARGEWIVFLGADDFLWDKNVVAGTVPFLQEALGKDIRYVYGKVNFLSTAGEILDVWGKSWEESGQNILTTMTVSHCGSFHHRQLFSDHGNFNETFRIAGDYEFLLREFTRGKSALFCDRVIAGMRAGGISANIRSKLVLARENIMARRLNHLPPAFGHRVQVWKAHVANILSSLIGVRNINRLSDLYRRLTGKGKLWSKIE